MSRADFYRVSQDEWRVIFLAAGLEYKLLNNGYERWGFEDQNWDTAFIEWDSWENCYMISTTYVISGSCETSPRPFTTPEEDAKEVRAIRSTVNTCAARLTILSQLESCLIANRFAWASVKRRFEMPEEEFVAEQKAVFDIISKYAAKAREQSIIKDEKDHPFFAGGFTKSLFKSDNIITAGFDEIPLVDQIAGFTSKRPV